MEWPVIRRIKNGIEVQPEPLVSVSVLLGCDQIVTLEKEFGPLIFASIRCRADFQSCQWVIERQSIKTQEWEEVARIEGQFDSEFEEDADGV